MRLQKASSSSVGVTHTSREGEEEGPWKQACGSRFLLNQCQPYAAPQSHRVESSAAFYALLRTFCVSRPDDVATATALQENGILQGIVFFVIEAKQIPVDAVEGRPHLGKGAGRCHNHDARR